VAQRKQLVIDKAKERNALQFIQHKNKEIKTVYGKQISDIELKRA